MGHDSRTEGTRVAVQTPTQQVGRSIARETLATFRDRARARVVREKTRGRRSRHCVPRHRDSSERRGRARDGRVRGCGFGRARGVDAGRRRERWWTRANGESRRRERDAFVVADSRARGRGGVRGGGDDDVAERDGDVSRAGGGERALVSRDERVRIERARQRGVDAIVSHGIGDDDWGGWDGRGGGIGDVVGRDRRRRRGGGEARAKDDERAWTRTNAGIRARGAAVG